MNSKPIWMGKTAETPVGPIWVAASETGLVAVSLWNDPSQFTADIKRLTSTDPHHAPEYLVPYLEQTAAFLHKQQQTFTFPIDWSFLTPFQHTVLQTVFAIPYGKVLTYRDVAQQIGQPKAVRAVGRANATNPMPIVIPCHRVLGADGKLHGYSAPGGLETKAWLLRLEGSWLI